MAAEQDIAIVAVDPAYTSRWGAQHWQKPLPTPLREIPGTMRRASRSGDAPSDTRSGDGRHRPTPTRVIVVGIGPSRPDRRPGGVRNPAPTFPDRAPDARRLVVERRRATLRLASGRLHVGTGVGFLEVVRVVVRDRDGDRSGARASNTRPGHGRHGTRNAGSMAAGREPSLPTGVLVR